jgi:hypothetical protein
LQRYLFEIFYQHIQNDCDWSISFSYLTIMWKGKEKKKRRVI